MASRSVRLLYCIWIAGASLSAALAANAAAREVVIRIVGDGGNAQYIEEGESAQEPVKVRVGDTVVWRNEGNRTHTATAENNDGDLLFDTTDIPGRSGASFSSSDPIEMTAEIFEAAGGQAGQAATIDYFCEHHSSMESSLVLSERGDSNRERARRRPRQRKATEEAPSRRADRGAARGAARMRRDITTLSSAELNAYRDAWRRIQDSGDYADIAGYHGCPDQFCHHASEQITFLPWHREYLLRLETALGEPLHYWDWTSPAAATSGIPRVFTDSTYVAPDGNTYPNPLRSYSFICPAGAPSTTTNRFPSLPSELSRYAGQVRTAYGSRSYRDVNSSLEAPPHNNLHGWVGGTMGGVYYAAYDPIFWAHHANVDRQWASWQLGGGPDPTAAEGSRSLRGFSGRTVDDVKSISALGYEYDRYDSMRGGLGPFATRGDARGQSAGVGKTFAVRLPRAAARDAQQAFDLLVSGIPEHPRQSYFVYVFVNQPQATPEDATPENPNFVGTFAVFGMGGPASGGERGEDHGEASDNERSKGSPRFVLQVPAGALTAARGVNPQVTLVATNESRAVVSSDEVPFSGVEVRAAGEAEDAEQPDDRSDSEEEEQGGDEFSGVSTKGSYDDAYRIAVRAAQEALSDGSRDRILQTEVVSVRGEHGGVAGVNRLTVTIRARLE